MAVALLVLGVVLRVLAAMPPKPKVSESGDIGHDITFEVRPQKKGSPTVHVDVAGTRLPAFRLKDGKPVDEQVRSLQQVVEHIARATASTSLAKRQRATDESSAASASQPPPLQRAEAAQLGRDLPLEGVCVHAQRAHPVELAELRGDLAGELPSGTGRWARASLA